MTFSLSISNSKAGTLTLFQLSILQQNVRMSAFEPLPCPKNLRTGQTLFLPWLRTSFMDNQENVLEMHPMEF